MHKSLYGDIICCFDLQAEVSLRNLFFVVLHPLVSLACILTSVSGMVGGGMSSHKPILKKKKKNPSTLGTLCPLVCTELSDHRYDICLS